MERCQKIYNHKLFRDSIEKIKKCEEKRIYCLHGIEHSIDVARIAYIKVLEENMDISKEVVYATALLHDCGRWMQYEKAVPHNIASVELAEQILPDCGFDAGEISVIIKAISKHRDGNCDTKLGEIIYFADNKSRMCMECSAIKTCKWSCEEMNMEVDY